MVSQASQHVNEIHKLAVGCDPIVLRICSTDCFELQPQADQPEAEPGKQLKTFI
jgi:hypothetical protein